MRFVLRYLAGRKTNKTVFLLTATAIINYHTTTYSIKIDAVNSGLKTACPESLAECLNFKSFIIDTNSNIKGKEKKEKPDRALDTMLRVTLANHSRLSQIADNKANILLSINAIIISISLSTLIPKLSGPGKTAFILPTFIMMGFCVTGIVFAILATSPILKIKKNNKVATGPKRINLLFFGSFSTISLDRYLAEMHVLMEASEDLYKAMITDLYYLGLVLERKYRLLRICYALFMAGTIVSVLSYLAAFYMM